MFQYSPEVRFTVVDQKNCLEGRKHVQKPQKLVGLTGSFVLLVECLSQKGNSNYWASPNNYYLRFLYLLFANYSQFEEVPIILKIMCE